MSCSNSRDCRAWYHHPIYDRYWMHYRLMQEWFQNSKNYELVGRDRPFHSRVRVPYAHRVPPLVPPVNFRTRGKSASPRGGFSNHMRHPNPNEFHDTVSCIEDEEDYPDEDEEKEEDDDEEMEFVIDDDFLEFMKHTEEFRKERDAERKRELGVDEVEYIDVSRLTVEGLPGANKKDVQARALEKSKRMKEWYGDKKANVVAGFEACMIATFQSYRVKHNPCMWPAMPLNLKFY